MSFAWLDLNTTWFVLLAVLFTGYAVLDGFDLGIGAIHLFVKGNKDRQTLLRAIGPVWDGNEVWLITGGGALFAAFPIAYATVFSGFYVAMILLLLALILRAVSIELRNMRTSDWWRRYWDFQFSFGSMLAALLLGIAMGNIIWGIPLDEKHEFKGTLGTLLHPYALLVGLTTLLLFTVHGAAYGMLKTEGVLKDTLRKLGLRAGIGGTLCLTTAIIVCILAIPHVTARVRAGPLVLILPVLTLLCMVVALHKLARDAARCAFRATCTAIVMVMAQAALGLYPSLVVSRPEPANSLTIYNAASSQRTLGIMLIVALLGMPLVLFYTAIVYRTFKGKVNLGEPGY